MPRRTAQRKQEQALTRAHLLKGETNDASGRWERNNKSLDATLVDRLRRNSERNKSARQRRGKISEEAWKEAYARAKSLLEREGDMSEPLPSFVQRFLPRRGRKR